VIGRLMLGSLDEGRSGTNFSSCEQLWVLKTQYSQEQREFGGW
jgi:hypothetical protein